MQEFSVLGLASVSGITVICYLVAEIVKQTPLPNKWLPSICGLLGGLLGIAGLFLVRHPPAAAGLPAAAVGLSRGLAATGANQLGRQLKN